MSQSIKNDPGLKILAVITDMQQHGNEVTKQQQNLSQVRKSLDLLSRQIAWQISSRDMIHKFQEKNPDPTKWSEEQKAKIGKIESEYLAEYQIEEKIRMAINATDIPMRALISVGNSLKRSADSLKSMAAAEIGPLARRELVEVMSRPLSPGGITIESAKADPYQAQAAEDRQEAQESILDMGDLPRE